MKADVEEASIEEANVEEADVTTDDFDRNDELEDTSSKIVPEKHDSDGDALYHSTSKRRMIDPELVSAEEALSFAPPHIKLSPGALVSKSTTLAVEKLSKSHIFEELGKTFPNIIKKVKMQELLSSRYIGTCGEMTHYTRYFQDYLVAIGVPIGT
ncbi:hypothetical protein F8M41_005737 [Gigaspora margarita]|uniref:Uncharacterized protein n=1 Tax=Gigaspora margarita TaxID=4874 RepID=A0A8H4AX47_GIGMA|nr:hypothetical protein F8M41_005737 [Gigaspora margarita]